MAIEVHFITLNDNFFERIGVDFDFTIAKNISNPQANGFSAPQAVTVGGQPFTAPSYTAIRNANSRVGLGIQGGSTNPASAGIFTQDNSINFSQGTYALGVPNSAVLTPRPARHGWLCHHSDIEAFFFINAASGDRWNERPSRRHWHALQRPAGGFVAGYVKTPFMHQRVIPVVGDFAAAQQPVIVVLSEGTFMTSPGRGPQRPPLRAIDDRAASLARSATCRRSLSRAPHDDHDQHDAKRHRQPGDPANLNNNNNDQSTTVVQRRNGPVAYVLLRHGDHDGQPVPDGGIRCSWAASSGSAKAATSSACRFSTEIPYLNRLFKERRHRPRRPLSLRHDGRAAYFITSKKMEAS